MPPASTLNPDFLLHTLAAQSGLPSEFLDPGAAVGLVEATVAHMKRRLFGQDDVLGKLGAALAARAAERHIGWDQAVLTLQPNWDRRPWLNVLAVGPTGVGKSETAKLLAERLFGGRLITLHGNDVGPEAAHGTSTWTGSPPGYIGSDRGGTLTNALRRWSSAVILIEEIEKASAEAIQNVLLTLMGDGNVTDRNNGETLWATDCIILCTGNILFDAGGYPSLGFIPTPNREQHDTALFDALTRHLRPEIVGRFHTVLSFQDLDLESQFRIWTQLRRDLENRIGPGSRIVLDEPARRLVQNRFAQLDTGARGVIDLFREQVVPLAVGASAGDVVHVTACEDGLGLVRSSENEGDHEGESP